MFDKISRILFCVIFILIMAIPMICTNLKPNQVSIIENRTLASFPVLYDEDGNKNNDFIADFENWFNDNVGYREQMFALNSKMQWHVFHNSPNDTVVVGKDGWLFYTEQNNLEIASGKYPDFDECVLQQICEEQIKVQEKLAQQGIEYVIILPPSKVSIYPEYLRGNFQVRRTPVDELADYLEAHSDIKIVRLKDTLLEAKAQDDRLLFFKTDTHWNAYGSYLAYVKIIEDLEKWGLIKTSPVEVEFAQSNTVRDLSLAIGNTDEQYAELNYVGHTISLPTAYKLEEGERYEAVQGYVQENGIRRGDCYENEKDELPSFLFFSDSMIMDCMGPLLAESSSEMTCIWHYSINQEVIDITNPDIVFLELSERSLNVLPGAEAAFVE